MIKSILLEEANAIDNHADKVVENYSGKHGRKEECREIMVKVENSTHRVKRKIMKRPSYKQPATHINSFVSHDLGFSIFCDASLFIPSVIKINQSEYRQQSQVQPPDYWISKKIDAICTSGEILAAVVNGPLPRT